MTAKEQMSKTLRCGITVSGEVYALAQLSAKFQIKARDYKLTDSESLAVWIDGDKEKVKTYFGSRIDDYHRDLESGKTKLQNAPKNWKL
jgi:acyl-ACP thioesterase